jgi:MAPEG family
MSLQDYLLPAVVTAAQILLFNFKDTLAVGNARKKHGVAPPKGIGHAAELDYALRVHANQVEQQTPFFVSLWVSAVLVSPLFAGIFGAIWVVLRQVYAHKYRAGGFSMDLLRYTIPCYMCINVLAIAPIVVLVAQRVGFFTEV